ncbi:hypothetical protein [Caudoviricetes sp.]|nr:hypothetical protein [Caudoviricetes sp.]
MSAGLGRCEQRLEIAREIMDGTERKSQLRKRKCCAKYRK